MTSGTLTSGQSQIEFLALFSSFGMVALIGPERIHRVDLGLLLLELPGHQIKFKVTGFQFFLRNHSTDLNAQGHKMHKLLR
jgi:hypothetical protein